MAELEGKLALVTGASSGIGRAVAIELARRGAGVALLARNRERLDAAAASVRELGARALVIGADVSSSTEVERAVGEVLEEFSRVDILVNNAGITRDNLLMRMREEDWDAVLGTNLKSAFLFCKALARTFLKQKGGRIINIASIVGLIGNPGQANYSASKGGLIALTYTLAKELASRNVLVNAVAPGFVETAMTGGLPEESREAAAREIPLGRFGSPEDIAGAVAFLAGPYASYVTGAVLRVDGGLSL